MAKRKKGTTALITEKTRIRGQIVTRTRLVPIKEDEVTKKLELNKIPLAIPKVESEKEELVEDSEKDSDSEE